jgi:hypothetical protein
MYPCLACRLLSKCVHNLMIRVDVASTQFSPHDLARFALIYNNCGSRKIGETSPPPKKIFV